MNNPLFTVSSEEFAAARGRIPSYKNRLLLVEAPKKIDLEQAITEGIRDGIDYLSQKSDSFSLPALEKWAKMMTDTKNAKAWPVVFKKRNGLYSTLKSIYEGIEHKGTGGGGMRGMYADFLTEASAVLNKPALKDVASHYRKLGKMWTNLAESCLPDIVKPLKETKSLVAQKYALLRTQGDAGLQEIKKISATLNAFDAKFSRQLPLHDDEIAKLFDEVQS